MKQRFSKESLRIGEKYTFKYDAVPNKLLENQLSWLEVIQRELPGNAFKELEWIDTNEEHGYMMETINGDNIGNDEIAKMISLVWEFEKIEAWPTNSNFESYIFYVLELAKANPHLYYNFDWKQYEAELKKYKNSTLVQPTFYHGDFTIHNVLVRNGQIIPIDPNHKRGDLWGSTMLDYSKMLQDIYFTPKGQYAAGRLKELGKKTYRLIMLLLISHYIRMFPYIKDQYIRDEKLSVFYKIVNELGLTYSS